MSGFIMSEKEIKAISYISARPGKFVNNRTGVEVKTNHYLSIGSTFTGSVQEWWNAIASSIICHVYNFKGLMTKTVEFGSWISRTVYNGKFRVLVSPEISKKIENTIKSFGKYKDIDFLFDWCVPRDEIHVQPTEAPDTEYVIKILDFEKPKYIPDVNVEIEEIEVKIKNDEKELLEWHPENVEDLELITKPIKEKV